MHRDVPDITSPNSSSKASHPHFGRKRPVVQPASGTALDTESPNVLGSDVHTNMDSQSVAFMRLVKYQHYLAGLLTSQPPLRGFLLRFRKLLLNMTLSEPE